MIRSVIAGPVCMIVITACATAPTPPSDAVQVPRDRLLARQSTNAKPSGTIVVIRDQGQMGGGCFQSFYIDGVIVARVDVGERAQFVVEPGEHLLRVGRDPDGKGLCQVQQDQWTQRETIIRAGETKAFRLTTDSGGRPDVQRAE